MTKHLTALSEAGVSIWLDDLTRSRLSTGGLAKLVEHSNVVGVTTNPSIFDGALRTASDDYADQIRDLALRGVSVAEAIRAITTYDVRWACDVFRPTFEATDGVDGRVSIEVDPRLAHDTAATAAEASALAWLVDRPQVFIKIPATLAGLPAISAVLASGISVNVTLIFGIDRYRAVMDAWLTGLERAAASGHDLATIESVASFFVSRVDSEVDKRLPAESDLRGTAAIANARLAYEAYLQMLDTPRWQALAAQGARVQRPLWASTGVKDPAYPDTRYVTDLVTEGVVNTMPEATLEAVRDHGVLAGDTIVPNIGDAQKVFAALAEAGIEIDDVTEVLEREGVQKFVDSWEQLLDTVATALVNAAPTAT